MNECPSSSQLVRGHSRWRGSLSAAEVSRQNKAAAPYAGCRAALVRLNKVAWIILNRRERATMVSLADELGVSRKTIGRDLEFLRSELGHDIRYGTRAGWFYGKAPLSFSDPNRRLLI